MVVGVSAGLSQLRQGPTARPSRPTSSRPAPGLAAKGTSRPLQEMPSSPPPPAHVGAEARCAARLPAFLSLALTPRTLTPRAACPEAGSACPLPRPGKAPRGWSFLTLPGRSQGSGGLFLRGFPLPRVSVPPPPRAVMTTARAGFAAGEEGWLAGGASPAGSCRS